MKTRTLLFATAMLGASIQPASASPTDDLPALLPIPGPFIVNQLVTGGVAETVVELRKTSEGGPWNCRTGLGNPSVTGIKISRARASHDVIHKALLASQLSGKPLSAVFIEHDGSNNCWLKSVISTP